MITKCASTRWECSVRHGRKQVHGIYEKNNVKITIKDKVVFKYGTGTTVPADGKYLSTVTQTKRENIHGEWIDCWLVWHYYEFDIRDEKAN